MIPDTVLHFAIIAWDGPDGPDIRMKTRDAHLAHVAANIGDYAIAGPLADDAGAFTGSLLIVKADSMGTARAMFHADPYFIAGLWDRTSISAFTPAAGAWIGGTIW